MITLEEAVKQDITFVGMETLPDFSITSRTDKGSYDRIWISDSIEKLFNTNLEINNYSAKAIKHLTFVYIVMQDTGKGVDWKERKYYDKEEKEFNIEIKFPNYNKFITSIFDPVQLISPIIRLKPETHLWIEDNKKEEELHFLEENVDIDTVVILNDTSPIFGNTRDVEGIAKIVHSKGGLFMVHLSGISRHLNFTDIALIDGHSSLLGPLGVSLLFIKSSLINKLDPKSAGSGTVRDITKTQLQTVASIEKFEVSPPNMPALLGLVASINFLMGLDKIQDHQTNLIKYLASKLTSIEPVHILTNLDNEYKSSITFTIDNIDLLDLTIMIDEMYDIEMYSGQLCSQIGLDKLGISSVAMVSVHIYNTQDDIDRLVSALKELIKILE